MINLSEVNNELLYSDIFIDNLDKTISTSNYLVSIIHNYKENDIKSKINNNFEKIKSYMKGKIDQITKDEFYKEYICDKIIEIKLNSEDINNDNKKTEPNNESDIVEETKEIEKSKSDQMNSSISSSFHLPVESAN